MKLRARRELPPARIEVIPMIDVMLFLLVFFMLSSLSLVRLNGLPVSLPEAQTGEDPGAAAPTLTITREGRFLLNRRPINAASLEAALRPYARGRALIVYADENARHGTVVRAMDAARTVGLSNLSLSTQPASAVAPAVPAPPSAIRENLPENREVAPETAPEIAPEAAPEAAQGTPDAAEGFFGAEGVPGVIPESTGDVPDAVGAPGSGADTSSLAPDLNVAPGERPVPSND